MNQSPVLPLNKPALWALLHFSMASIMLALVVISDNYPQGFIPNPIKSRLKIYEDVIQTLFMLHALVV